MAVLIKRYANRKLYNTQTSRYITLKGIAELIEQGEDVRVIDNETGDDITSVALSQILVDNERAKGSVQGTVLTELIQRGGDVLYTALRKGVGDASESIEEIQKNVVRRFIRPREDGGEDEIYEEEIQDNRPLSERIAEATDVERIVQRAMERVMRMLDLPRRSDIDALNQNLERVAKAIEAIPGAAVGSDEPRSED